MTVPAFPLAAPFRIDQVSQAPLLLVSLFVAEGLLAMLVHLAAVRGWQRLWWGALAGLLALVALFFTLASWGNSDTTRFSHYLQWNPDLAPPEPLWRLLAPLILLLPYRMAAVQGLVAAGFAAAPALLARLWGVPAWAGWWALLITCSPMLRGFLQNAHTRQALATLLLLPLLLQTARLVQLRRRWLGLGVVLSAMTHNTFVLNLPLSLAPLLLRLPELGARLGRPREQDSPGGGTGRQLVRRFGPWLLMLAGLVLFLLVAPVAFERFQDYAQDEYYNRYPLRSVVGRLQRALFFGLLLGCLQRRLTPLQLLRCPITLLLLFFGLLYVGVQQSIAHLWLPQIISRLADAVGFFLLILYLAWLQRYRVLWCLLPALYVTLQYWLEGRLLPSGTLPCGRNDDFLCIPDRWPWQVRY
ncbi:MAG: hypothetical protein VKJ05_07170 [Synechococcaceae cyanobacterium]|nr:hypothetical protein [Synechococcaceae cyanobacterium]